MKLFDLIHPKFSGFHNIKSFEQSNGFWESSGIQKKLLGTSEQGHPIEAYLVGQGTQHLLCVSGHHAEECVGTESLKQLLFFFHQSSIDTLKFKEQYTLHIIPQVNPDGEMNNEQARQAWPSFSQMLPLLNREGPGRDLEFGYPDLRTESTLLSNYMSNLPNCKLYINLHGMSLSEGVLCLIDPKHQNESDSIQQHFIQFAQKSGCSLHDLDRQGEKGFYRLAPGVSTTPDSKKMKSHFLSLNDRSTASKFKFNSMEWLDQKQSSPLCLVSELPLFIIHKKWKNRDLYENNAYSKIKNEIKQILIAKDYNDRLNDLQERFDIRAFDPSLAMRLHYALIDAGLQIIQNLK